MQIAFLTICSLKNDWRRRFTLIEGASLPRSRAGHFSRVGNPHYPLMVDDNLCLQNHCCCCTSTLVRTGIYGRASFSINVQESLARSRFRLFRVDIRCRSGTSNWKCGWCSQVQDWTTKISSKFCGSRRWVGLEHCVRLLADCGLQKGHCQVSASNCKMPAHFNDWRRTASSGFESTQELLDDTISCREQDCGFQRIVGLILPDDESHSV